MTVRARHLVAGLWMAWGAFAPATARAADLATRLVGYWKLDEAAIAAATVAVDASPTRADGVYQNAPTPDVPAPGARYADRGSVLFSRAATQAVRVTPVSDTLKPPAATLSAWVRLRTALPASGVAGQADVVSVGDQIMLRLYATQVGTAKRIEGQTWTELNARATVGTGAWHHLAATIDETAMAIYLDGAMLATMPDAHAITYDLDTADLWIGRFGGGSGRDFDGNIDEVAIWARVLNASEIAALAAGAQPGTAAAPAADAASADSGVDGGGDAGGGRDGAAPGSDAAGGGSGGDAPAAPDALGADGANSGGTGGSGPDASSSGGDASGPVTDGSTVESRYPTDGSRPPPPAASGCACATAPRSPTGAGLLLAVALAVRLVRRRR